jgi:hypothetical protein
LIHVWPFGVFSPVLVWCTTKNLATLCYTRYSWLVKLHSVKSISWYLSTLVWLSFFIIFSHHRCAQTNA